MAGRRPGDNPLSEPMMVILLTHICVTRCQHAFTCPTKRFMANSRKTIEGIEGARTIDAGYLLGSVLDIGIRKHI